MKLCLRCGETFSRQEWTCPACGYEPTRLDGFEAHAVELAHGGAGFKSEYFSELAKLESGNFWFRARNELILWALHTYQPDAREFLEIGCGTGFVLSGIAESYPDVSLSGSEVFLEGLSHAASRVVKADFMQMDARQIPFLGEFDAIGAFDVLEHIDEDEAVLFQIHKALRANGVLFLTVPQHPWLWSASDDHACHVRRYTHAEIEAKVRNSGFQILKSTSFVTLLLPAMMLSRALQKKTEDDFDPTGELKINPVLNRVFFSLMMLDIAGIRVGLTYPLGGSRLVVARKA